MSEYRTETDSLGEVKVPNDKLWGAQTQRSLERFSIGKDLIPREMVTAYAILKEAAANANFAGKRLDQMRHNLILQVRDEILVGRHRQDWPHAHGRSYSAYSWVGSGYAGMLADDLTRIEDALKGIY